MEALHQETLHGAELIVRDENSRRLRLRILLLEEEVADLNEQLCGDDERITDLEQERDDLKAQLEQNEEEARRIDGNFRLATREVNGLKVSIRAVL